MGLTILVVWAETGPSAWIREKLLRPLLPGIARPVLDCYICLSFWVGLLMAPVWWRITGEIWPWFNCLMTPAAFWIVLNNPRPSGGDPPLTAPNHETISAVEDA